MDMPEEEIYLTVKKYIDKFPSDLKVDETTYQERLKACRSCEKLQNGTCMVCGCYVEMRALAYNQSCPACSPRWKRISKTKNN